MMLRNDTKTHQKIIEGERSGVGIIKLGKIETVFKEISFSEADRASLSVTVASSYSLFPLNVSL